MITVSLINMKGGVGKTTLAVNLAWHMHRQGKRVLLVDLDPQFNASQYMMAFERYDAHRKKFGTVADLLVDASKSKVSAADRNDPSKLLRLCVQIERDAKANSYLFLLPSDLALATAVKNPQGVEFRLQKVLDAWSQWFDYVFIDCAPTDTVLTATALMSSDFLLVPMRPDRFSILGYEMIKESVTRFRTDYPDPKRVRDLGVVFTSVSREPDPIELECKAKVKAAAEYAFSTEIHASRTYLRAANEQTAVFDTRYARQLTRQDIDQFVAEMLRRISHLRANPRPQTAALPSPFIAKP